MNLLLILGIFAFWLYVGYIIYRRGNLPTNEDIGLELHSKPSDAFYAKRRESDRESKKWRTERFKIGRRK